MKRNRFLSLLLGITLLAPWANATTVYVDRNAPGPTHDGASWATAYLTVTESLTGARSGTEVWVAKGTYTEAITIPAGVSLYGGFSGAETERDQRDWSANTTVLDGTGQTSYYLVTCSAQGILVDGFTLNHAYWAVNVSAGIATFSNNTITANQSGVMVGQSATATLIGNTISDNHAPECKGVSSSGRVTLTNNIISNNTYNSSGVYISAGSATLTGNVITGNSDGVSALGGTATLTGNTISDNDNAGVWVGGVAILTGNTVSGSAYGVTIGNRATLTGNTIYDNREWGVSVGGTATLTNDIVASNRSSGLVIQGTGSAYSVTIAGNGGNGLATYSGAKATLRNCTITGNNLDGAYLYSGSAIVANTIVAFNSGRGVYKEGSATMTAFTHNDVYGNTLGGYAGYTPPADQVNISLDPRLTSIYNGIHIQPDSPCVDAGLDTAVAGSFDLDGQPRVQGAHVDIGADESDGTTWPATPRVRRVAPSGDDANDGLTWATAKKTVGAALWTSGTDEVWVARGTYTENTISMPAGAGLYGGFAGTEVDRNERDWKANPTVLVGDGVASAVSGVTIDGFTILGGRVSGYAVNISGGTATIANNIITAQGNPATRTGVRIYRANAVIANNVISGNGYGIWSVNYEYTSTLTLASNVLASNVDAVILQKCQATFTNNTISANRRGVSVEQSTTTFTNNIVAFHAGFGLNRSGGSVSAFSHNDFYGNLAGDFSGYTPPAGQGNITADPWLSNRYHDLHIQPGSPCRDAGDDSAFEAGATDMDGQPRKQGAHVDIGADESDGTMWTIPPLTLYVSPAGDDGNDGKTWATAKRTVTAALSAAQGTDEVWVGKGVYAEHSLIPKPGVALYGGFAGAESSRSQRDRIANPAVLDSGSTGYITVECLYPYVTVDGFTIRNGWAPVEMSCGQAVVSNNTITRGSYHGVMINAGSTVFANNTVSDCPSGVEIGIGSLLDSGQVTVSGNTITANNRNGIEINNGRVSIDNNIVALNGQYGISIENGVRIPALSHNDVFGNADGNYNGLEPSLGPGNISVDPKLSHAFHDVHLQPDSPCIDAGDDTAVIGTEDVDGQPRIRGAHVDIGSDESDGTAWVVPSVAWHVSPAGDDAKDGLTWDTAKRTVAAALAASQGTDEVWVAQGTYPEKSLVVPAAVALYGGFAGTEMERGQRDCRANETVLDGGRVDCPNRDTVVDGFTIRVAPGDYEGYGVSAGSGPVAIANNTIMGNAQFGSYGIRTDYSKATISNNTISGHGNGLNLSGKITLTGNVISGNFYYGVALSSGTHTITNNTIANNTQAGMYVDYGTVSLVNNIVAFAEKGVQIGSSATILAFSHNDVFGNTNADYVDYTPPSDMGNISLDPLFNDRANGNFHLLSGSPCIDAGDDSAVAGGSTDLDGRPRILGARVDIGAYEYTAASQPFQLADVTRCLSIACGVRACSPDDLSRLNVESGDAGLDILDATRLARKVAGLEANP